MSEKTADADTGIEAVRATAVEIEEIAPDPAVPDPGPADQVNTAAPPRTPPGRETESASSFQNNDDYAPEFVDRGGENSQGSIPPLGESRGGAIGLPNDFPVQPIGQYKGQFYFLTSRGELVALAANQLANRSNLVALMVGVPDAMRHLAEIAPAMGKDVEFNAQAAGDRLMMACSALPLFDPEVSIRHFGTWRGSDGSPVMHLGEKIECGETTPRRGRVIAGALYPTVPSGTAPGDAPASTDDIAWVRDRINRFWAWGDAGAGDVLIGWIGQAALGQFPSWRTHLWIKGKLGAGKTAALRIIAMLLGGMCTGVKQASSAAAIRQTSNRQAIARIFDEAESDGTGRMEEVISLFRLMSDAHGAQIERGTSDHTGVKFQLYGAGLMASIIPGIMTPADRSRFVILDLAEIPKAPGRSPADAALLLAELKRDARELGPGVWRRMIDLAPSRWDQTFDTYSAMVQGLGARARSGDTIGAILAGWDLMLFDEPLATAEDRQDRLDAANKLAMPLIEASLAAEDEGEGERCLRTVFAYMIDKDHGGKVQVAELLERLIHDGDEPGKYDQRLIGRVGLKVLPGERGKRELFVANGQHPQMDRAMWGTRWKGGGHRAALDTLPNVRPSPDPTRVAGSLRRGLIIPLEHLPEDTSHRSEGV